MPATKLGGKYYLFFIWNIPTGGTVLKQKLSPSSAMLHIGTGEHDPISQHHRGNGINPCRSSTPAGNIRYILPAGTMSIALFPRWNRHIYSLVCDKSLQLVCMYTGQHKPNKPTNKQTNKQQTSKQQTGKPGNETNLALSPPAYVYVHKNSCNIKCFYLVNKTFLDDWPLLGVWPQSMV